MKRKMIALMMASAMCLSLTACNSSNYTKAEELLSSGDYSAALEIYTDLGDYEDSQDKAKKCTYEIANECFEQKNYKNALENYSELGDYEDAKDKAAECEKEIGMSENADYAFLADMKSSVLGRLESSNNNEDHTTIVNTELAYLDKYTDETFYDKKLQELAKQYIAGVHTQKDALDEDEQSKHQIEWQRGYVERCEALSALYKQYGFLADNPDFIGAYVTDLENEQHILAGYEAIENDLDKQMLTDDFEWYPENDLNIYCTLKNNTEYTFAIFVDVSYYDENGTLYYSDTGYSNEVKPGESYVLRAFVSDMDRLDHLTWSTYFDYVK